MKILKKVLSFCWKVTTVNISDTHDLELGGFLLSLGIVLGIAYMTGYL